MFYFLIRSENINFPYLDSLKITKITNTTQITTANCCTIIFEEEPASIEVILFVSVIQAFVMCITHFIITFFHCHKLYSTICKADAKVKLLT